MGLYSDASPCDTSVNNEELEQKLNKDILQKIEDDLDIDEKISILFLMISNYSLGFQEVYDLLQRYKEGNSYILTKFIDGNPLNWKSKLLEALCIIQNRQIIRKLGIPFSYLEQLYLPKHRLCSRKLNLIAKCLYFLCEALTETDIKVLVQYVKDDFTEYEKDLKDTDHLELHILYWLQQKYILIHSAGKSSLQNLLKHLKKFDTIELIYEDLKKREDYQDVLDIQNMNLTASQLSTFSVKEEIKIRSNNQEEDIKKLKKGLCIIISEKFFSGQNFETRDGTDSDENKLSETFKSFGFTVNILNNLKKHQMLEKLKDIPKEYGTDYDCIFVCILSHGCKGGIICSDEKQVSIEAIEHQICCEELKDAIKVVIIQACQGEVEGKAEDDLTMDGPSIYNKSNILAYRNFCIFMSTMQGFVSVRHKAKGSWFIQEFCNILQNEGHKITFLHAARKITESVTNKKGKLNGTNSIAQLPELRPCRLIADFWLPGSEAGI